MPFFNPGAEAFVPDGSPLAAALARTTHLGIAAHPDDLEIMACHGILACMGTDERWFTGVIMTDGRGSPRTGTYSGTSDDEMRLLRRSEQHKAAVVGELSALVMLDYASATVKEPRATGPIVEDLFAIVAAMRPVVVYTHNLADTHDTHVATALRAIAALLRLPLGARPRSLYGCEVWRDLEWLPPPACVSLDVSGRDHLIASLIGVHDSQVSGGKPYDIATLGRLHAHATYRDAHAADAATSLALAMDLSPLLRGEATTPAALLDDYLHRFGKDARDRLARMGGT